MAADRSGAGDQARPSGVLVWFGRIAFFSGLLAIILAMVGPLLYRQDVVELLPALLTIPAALVLAVVAVLFALLFILLSFVLKPRPGLFGPLFGGVVGLALLVQIGPIAGPLVVARFAPDLAKGMDVPPPIHDITTDTDNPPLFQALLERRAQDGAVNPPEYVDDGGEVAAQQKQAYPDIQPLVLNATSVGAVLNDAKSVARDLGWTVITEARPSDGAPVQVGRMEATQTSFWFGFTDDIVVRITQQPNDAVRVDVRSKSRVGISDLGANAKRIRAFLSRLKERA